MLQIPKYSFKWLKWLKPNNSQGLTSMYLKVCDKEFRFFKKSFKNPIQISDKVKNKQKPYLENSIGPKRLFLTSEQRTGSSLSLIWELRPSRISSTLSGVSSPSASHQVLHSRIADPYLKYRVKRSTRKKSCIRGLFTSISCWDKLTLALCFAGQSPPVDARRDHGVAKPENIMNWKKLLTLKNIGNI